MGTIVPIELIEITQDYGEKTARVAGTRIRVAEVVMMHLRNDSPIEWIVENFEVLDHAKIHAALAYYYAHQDEIDAELDAPRSYEDGMTLAQLKEKIRLRQAGGK